MLYNCHTTVKFEQDEQAMRKSSNYMEKEQEVDNPFPDVRLFIDVYDVLGGHIYLCLFGWYSTRRAYRGLQAGNRL